MNVILSVRGQRSRGGEDPLGLRMPDENITSVSLSIRPDLRGGAGTRWVWASPRDQEKGRELFCIPTLYFRPGNEDGIKKRDGSFLRSLRRPFGLSVRWNTTVATCRDRPFPCFAQSGGHPSGARIASEGEELNAAFGRFKAQADKGGPVSLDDELFLEVTA